MVKSLRHNALIPQHILKGTVIALSMAVMVPPQLAGAADQAARVLATARAAMGGAAWDQISGWHERGHHGDAAYDTLLDFHRYGTRFANIRGNSAQVHGYNGAIVWDQDADGKVTISHDAAILAEARQSAYGSIFGFFFPERFAAQFEYLGTRTQDDASFDVVRVTPEGATPMEVWVDRSKHLVARLVDRGGPKPVTAALSDYRRLGGVLEPSRIDVSDGDPAHAKVGSVGEVVLEPIQRTAFDPPA